ncbi:protein lifeguard 1 isoform X1 [Conger conger]|uniref:protein lifeguard 1 isoform X1 n=1 Tax=Conger conger TaxID=82655 RepID=UPI002A59E038|nr:protein lifeguard 1 isoform X1 [Conger conger]
MAEVVHAPSTLGPDGTGPSPPPQYDFLAPGPSADRPPPMAEVVLTPPTLGPDGTGPSPPPQYGFLAAGPSADHPPPYMPPPYPTSAEPYPPPHDGDADAVSEQWPPVDSSGVDTAPTDDTASGLFLPSFEDKTIRRAFIRKVFSVVTLQLLVTFSVVCVFTFSETVKETVQKNLWVYLSSYILFVIVAVSLSICSSFSRQHPWNLVGLSVVTLTMSYMVGTVASYHNTTAVIIAMGITIGVSFAIIIFSAQTRVDFTLCNGTLLILSVILLMSGFFCFFFYSNVVQVVYGSLGAILYSVFLAVDCQLVMGRKKYSLDPEEYVFASLILYLDIITIFLYLLILLGGSSSN